MSKNVLKVFILAPFLMATTCDDDMGGTLIFNNYTIEITPQSNFSINDVIWLEGKVTSMVFDTAANDSIFAEWAKGDELSVMKFIQPTQSSNCVDAIDNFELIIETGGVSFLPICENGQMTAHSELSADSLYYQYRIGLKAMNAGDYVLSWNHSDIANEIRNDYILDEYPMEFHPNQLGFNKCGWVSWRFVNDSEREFYFRVQ